MSSVKAAPRQASSKQQPKRGHHASDADDVGLEHMDQGAKLLQGMSWKHFPWNQHGLVCAVVLM
jgi:hypothetical protein